MTSGSRLYEPPVLTGAALVQWCDTGLRTLRQHQAHLDYINYFGEPDKDTGENLVQLLSVLQQASPRAPSTITTVSEVLQGWTTAAYAHPGIEGNSAWIVRAALDAMDDAAAGRTALDSDGIALVLSAGAAGARRFLGSDATAGTILDVFDAVAETASQPNHSVPAQLAAAAAAADRAQAATQGKLTVLRTQGVVDAGALGLTLLLRDLAQISGRRGR